MNSRIRNSKYFVDSISHTCLGNSTGTAIINASNGKPPYFYYWSHGLNSRILTNASVGKYIANVGDANYCINSQEIMINEIPKCTAAFTYSIKGIQLCFLIIQPMKIKVYGTSVISNYHS
ncbi:MAG: SprB repeat-containing protein [Saprospiraceae bacterium]|nr:SprB repeat-containing protein [Saprospiraceae bacterium]